MHFGQAIKIALIKKGKSQSWLANELSVSRQAISNMVNSESGNTETINRIARALEIKASELIAYSE